MTYRVRQRTYGDKTAWEADIHVRLPDGTVYRERRNTPARSRAAAVRFAKAREAELIRNGPSRRGARRRAPSVAEFTPRFLELQRRVGRKPSTIANLRTNLERHVIPSIGAVRLDRVTQAHVERVTGGRDLRIGTVNKIRATLSSLLGAAARDGVIEAPPVKITALREPSRPAPFYTEAQYLALTRAASDLGPRVHAAVRLGGDAGLRAGEIRALEWRAVDLRRGVVSVEQSEWEGRVTAPKSGRFRVVPLSAALTTALAELPRTDARVLRRDDGRPVTKSWLLYWIRKAERAAGLPVHGVHVLRHTFCSHLAMRGAVPRAIQQLAGHSSLRHTERYMHLTPTALRDAIGLLDGRG